MLPVLFSQSDGQVHASEDSCLSGYAALGKRSSQFEGSFTKQIGYLRLGHSFSQLPNPCSPTKSLQEQSGLPK